MDKNVRTLFTEYNYSDEDMLEVLLEELDIDDISDDSISEARQRFIEQDWDDFKWEINNFIKDKDNFIICEANLGLWDGRQLCYKIIRSKELSSFLSSNSDSYIYIYDETGEFIVREIHHDGTNYIKYRFINEDKLPKKYDDISVIKGRNYHEDMQKIFDKYSKKLNFANEVYGKI